MYQKPSAPRSVGGVLDDTLQLYKASFSSCWLPSLLITVISAGLSYYMLASMPPTPVGQLRLMDILARYSTLGLAFYGWYVLVIVASLVFYGMLFLNIAAVARGETPAFGTSMAQAIRRAPALFGASIVFTVAVGLATCLLIIPGIYVMNRLWLYMVPLEVEPQGPLASLGTSWRLVSGNWWRTASVVTVLFVILIVLELVLTSLAGILALLIGGLPSDATHLAAKVSAASLLIGGFVRIFTTPIVCAVLVALYHDLSLRKGGGDLETRLGALPQT